MVWAVERGGFLGDAHLDDAYLVSDLHYLASALPDNRASIRFAPEAMDNGRSKRR